jgi:23S rRNA pseudouridine1911/1915/1917 synthase
VEPLYEDNHLLALAKPAGMPVVPDASGDASLLDLGKAWVKQAYAKPGEVFLGVVHRLDRPVSGVVVFARTSKAAKRLQAAWQTDGEVVKTYLARSAADWPAGLAEEGEWRQWLWKDRERNRVTVTKREGAREAVTRYRRIAGGSEGAALELAAVTGRPHQLRVACATAGMPLLGDLKYGAPTPLPDKSVGLHAWRLDLPHPTRDERMRFEAPPPSWARVPRDA